MGHRIASGLHASKQSAESLDAYLNKKVFASKKGSTIAPDPTDVAGFATFMERYKAGLVIEKTAVEMLKE